MHLISALPLIVAEAAPAGTGLASLLPTLALPLGMLAILYFLMIRPQKKQEKVQKEQRSKLAVGDNIITIGGMIGKVVNIKDDDITIATSVANTLVTYKREAINSVKKTKTDEA